MPDNPFARLRRRSDRQAALLQLRDAALRPLRPSRIRIDRPGPANLILVGVDTLRADHLGCNGYTKPTSPDLDRLARLGTVFTDVTAPAPWTLPSFSSALSAVMPGVHRAYLSGPQRNMDEQAPGTLDPGIVTLAGHLCGQGYRTAAFYSNQFFAFGLAESFEHHRYRNLAAGDLARCALEWIRRNADRPFFCFILLNDPHEPTTPRPQDLGPFLAGARAQGCNTGADFLRGLARWGKAPAPDLGRIPLPIAPEAAKALALKLAIYDGTIREVDGTIGRIGDQLKDWGLDAGTVMSVFSDHGEEFHDHALWADHWGHDPRGIHGIGHGHTLFREVLQVPWVSWGPGVPQGVRREDPASLMDLSPTLLDWLGLPPLPIPGPASSPLAGALAGRSLAGSPPAEDRPILSEGIAYGPDLVSVRRGRWKLIAHRDGRPLALFDLDTDPAETLDHSKADPHVLADLLQFLKEWRETGLGADGESGGTAWNAMDDTVRQRLKDLGYSE